METRPLLHRSPPRSPASILACPLDAATVDAIWSAIDRYAVVVFRDQRLTDAQLRDFAARFGPLEIGRRPPRRGGRAGWRSRRSATSPTSTRTTASAPATTGAGSTASATGCGTPTPPTCRCRSCSACCTRSRCRRPRRSATARPSSPTCAPPTTRCRTRPSRRSTAWSCEHDVFWSRGQIGFTEFPPGEREQYPPSPQRLVRRIPARSARRCICPRMPRTSSAGRWRMAACCCGTSPRTRRSAQFVYSHTWRVGDLVIWDNRCHHASRPAAR